MAVRGCGTRSYGGVYIEVKMALPGEPGTPPETFAIDPVREVPDGLDIPHRGVSIIRRPNSEVYDVWDRVGKNFYRNMEDFWQELKKIGISRRLSAKTDFSLLTPESRLVLIHERAMLINADELYRAIDIEMGEMVDANHWVCRCGKPDHDQYPLYARDSQDMMSTCVSSWAEVVEGGSEFFDTDHPVRTVERTIGDITYKARRAPLGFTPEYESGIFGIFPITCLAVINDPQSRKHIESMERASHSKLEVRLEDE